jgi:DNA polymerase
MITAVEIQGIIDAEQTWVNAGPMPDEIFLDYETKSEIDLKKKGLDLYANDPSTKILMVTWCEDKTTWHHWNILKGPFPPRLKRILEDPKILKRAFNAQFERVISRCVLKLQTGYEDWKCTMCHAYMMGFSGTLGQVGAQVGIPKEYMKLKEGLALIKFFSIPVTLKDRKKEGMFRDPMGYTRQFNEYCVYNVYDVIAEMSVSMRIDREKYPIPPSEWKLYALDQIINDEGAPIDMQMATNAIVLKDRRKEELTEELRKITGLGNPNSTAQLLPWLKKNGYPFDDCQSSSIKTAAKRFSNEIKPIALTVMGKRRWAASTSHGKYQTIATASREGRFRYSLQFCGASRTSRWAGRRVQTQNLPRTPKCLEPEDGDYSKLAVTTDIIRDGLYDDLALWIKEPMEAIVGCIRSTFRAEKNHQFRVVDLASIESVVIGWLTDCHWFQEVLESGKDIYKSFAMHLYNKTYDEVTKGERGMAKPATLGCGYRLGGGFETEDFKRTGLWGYAENMGIEMTGEESAHHVKVFRELCPEIVKYWYELEDAAVKCMRSGKDVKCGKITFELRKPFLAIRLPSGRRLWYFQPRLEVKKMKGKNGRPDWEKVGLTYMGMNQDTKKWSRVDTHGGKLVENIVQAIARDILKAGLMRAHADGFNIVMHVHDEIVTHHAANDDYHTVDRLTHCMTAPIKWASGMHLGGAGWAGPFYMKD